MRSTDACPSRRALGARQQLGPYKERERHRVPGWSNKRNAWQAGSAVHGHSSSERERACESHHEYGHFYRGSTTESSEFSTIQDHDVPGPLRPRDPGP